MRAMPGCARWGMQQHEGLVVPPAFDRASAAPACWRAAALRLGTPSQWRGATAQTPTPDHEDSRSRPAEATKSSCYHAGDRPGRQDRLAVPAAEAVGAGGKG